MNPVNGSDCCQSPLYSGEWMENLIHWRNDHLSDSTVKNVGYSLVGAAGAIVLSVAATVESVVRAFIAIPVMLFSLLQCESAKRGTKILSGALSYGPFYAFSGIGYLFKFLSCNTPVEGDVMDTSNKPKVEVNHVGRVDPFKSSFTTRLPAEPAGHSWKPPSKDGRDELYLDGEEAKATSSGYVDLERGCLSTTHAPAAAHIDVHYVKNLYRRLTGSEDILSDTPCLKRICARLKKLHGKGALVLQRAIMNREECFPKVREFFAAKNDVLNRLEEFLKGREEMLSAEDQRARSLDRVNRSLVVDNERLIQRQDELRTPRAELEVGGESFSLRDGISTLTYKLDKLLTKKVVIGIDHDLYRFLKELNDIDRRFDQSIRSFSKSLLDGLDALGVDFTTGVDREEAALQDRVKAKYRQVVPKATFTPRNVNALSRIVHDWMFRLREIDANADIALDSSSEEIDRVNARARVEALMGEDLYYSLAKDQDLEELIRVAGPRS